MTGHTDRRLSTDIKRVWRWTWPNALLVAKWAVIGFGYGLWWFTKTSAKVGLVITIGIIAAMAGVFKPLEICNRSAGRNSDG